MNVAIFLYGLHGIEGGGGAERFFSEFYDLYSLDKDKKNTLYFLTDQSSKQILQKSGRLKYQSNILLLKVFHNRFKNTLEALQIVYYILFKRISIIHIALYNKHYNGIIRLLNYLPSFIRPKIVIQIVDAQIPYAYSDLKHDLHNHFQGVYSELFASIKFDAIFTWYHLFKETAEKEHWIRCKPYMEAAKSRFTNNEKFKPLYPKKNIIIWAARLSDVKEPLFFVEAIHILNEMHPEIFKEWEIKLFGKGELKEITQAAIDKYQLNEILKIQETGDLSQEFGHSKCFVSTQNYENFPSLSMNEAMAAGNAIIARNVGQTYYFLKDGVNGIMLKEDTPKSLAEAMLQYIKAPLLHEKYSEESVNITKNMHTPKNFFIQMDAFWERVKNQ